MSSSWVQHHGFVCPVDITAEVVYELEDGSRGLETAINVYWGDAAPGEGRVVRYLLLDSVPDQTLTSKPTNPKDVIGVRKTPVSTVPAGVIMEVGLAMLEGAAKYGRHNYRVAGVRSSVYYDASVGHVMDWWEGEDIDPDSGISHVTKAIASLVVLRDSMLQGKLVDDRPPRSRVLKRDFNPMAGQIIDRHADKRPHHCTELTDPAAPQ